MKYLRCYDSMSACSVRISKVNPTIKSLAYFDGSGTLLRLDDIGYFDSTKHCGMKV